MRRNRILVGLVAALALAAWWAGAFDPNPSTVRLPDLDVPVGEPDRIAISAGSAPPVVLVKTAGTWALERPDPSAADSAAVARLVRDLGEFKLVSVVSRSADRYERYGVDSSATEIVATWADDEVRIVVSADGPDFGSNYVRVGDDPNVYATRARLSVSSSPDFYLKRPPGVDE